VTEPSFTKKSAIASGVAIGLILLVVFVYYSLYVLLLAFAGALIAVVLRGLADWLSQRTGMGMGLSLGVVIVASLLSLAALVVFVGASVNARANEFAEKLPESAKRVEEQLLQRYPWLSSALGSGSFSRPAGQSLPPPREPPVGLDALAPSAGAEQFPAPASQPTTGPSTQPTLLGRAAEAVGMGDVAGAASRAIQRLIGGVVALVVVLVVAIYLAAQPNLYIAGFLHLLPKKARKRSREVFTEMGIVLRGWITAQLIPMAVIGVLTAVGLKIIGVEMWLTLGLLAGLFNFVPNFGPLISFIPAVLFALAGDDGTTRAAWVLVLYVIAQTLEGYVLTPLVQKRAIELPPAILILAQVLLGILAGGLGIVLAAPLTAAAFVVVKMAWVREALNDPVPLPSDEVKK
jgi:predicted PurR-regulated permease PerM